ncbi:MAG: PAS domain-containing protein, partial [Methylococcales bacterium]|nr:PAS domain-containing protein [Methylococcales bacterium]
MRLSKPVCVLLVEANPADVQRIQIALRQFKDQPFEVMRAAGPGVAPKKTVDSRALDMHFKVTWVVSQAEALQKISESNFDILLLGLPLPDSQGLSAVRTVTQAVASAPIIVLLNQEETYYADTVLKAGAKNYIVKDTAGYGELIRVMRYALQRADVETQNQLLAAGLKATSNAIIITDKDMRIEWVNPAFTQLTGFSFLDALGRRPAELLKSDIHDQLSYQDMWQKLLDTGQWQGEIINRHKDGSLYNADVGISSVRNKEGVLSGYVHVHRDISDSVVRLAISEVLRQCIPLPERFKKVLDILFNLKTFDLQRKGGIFIRAKGENYLSLHTLHGVFSKEFIAKEQRVQCGSCLCGRVAISGKLLVSDDCFCDPRHEHTFQNMQAHGHYIVPITFDTEVLGVLFLYTDPYPTQAESRLTMLTQVGEMMALALRQEDARNALEAARDMAMRASLVKSEFLANMSHEIRTPMNGVLGMLDLLRDTPMSPTQQDWLETAHSSAHTLLDIINDILDFSKLEAGKFEVELVDFNLVDLVDDICALLAGRAFAAGLELNCALPVPMPPQWRGDPMRIRQVLTNLVGNAVKFTEQGE